MRKQPRTIDPAINGLVGLLSAHQSYFLAVDYARRHNKSLPPAPHSDRLIEAQMVQAAIADALSQHGNAQEQVIWESFLEEPDTFEDSMLRVLGALAGREAVCAAHIQMISQQTSVVSARRYAGREMGNACDATGV